MDCENGIQKTWKKGQDPSSDHSIESEGQLLSAFFTQKAIA
jgi:hypothetical protein